MMIFFYAFASLMLISSVFVIASKNPVHSVFWLIFAFCNASGLMILIGAEFLAMMLIVVYVGAVAVLFLFVVMMLDINLAEFKGGIKNNISATVAVALVMFADLVAIILLGMKTINLDVPKEFAIPADMSNIHAIGNVLYTDFILPFQMIGLILFTAIIACIVLTLRHKFGVKRQDVSKQLESNKSSNLSVVNVAINAGMGRINYDD